MLKACGLTQRQMPELREGTDHAGTLKPELAKRWGMKEEVIFAGGAGDNAAGAVGIGALGEGQAFISLGTSGVYFSGTDQFRACPEKTVHAFCHAITNTWHQMGVILSAASCIKSAAKFLGAESDEALAKLINTSNLNLKNPVVFLPYLSGERTPHNNPAATGAFFGLTHETTRADLVQSILEGVAFAFADCQEALAAGGTNANDIMLIGGGARNPLWGSILSAALDKRILYVADGDQGPAYGAAKLARLAATGEGINHVAIRPEIIKTVIPEEKIRTYLHPKLKIYRRLYNQLAPVFADAV
jgi:xylulokinase